MTQEYWENRAQSGTWGSLYAGAPDGRTYNVFTRRQAVGQVLKGDATYPRILDVGCGTGDYVAALEDHLGRYVGMDFSPSMVTQGREQFSGRDDLSFLAGSGEDMPFADDVFDLVVAIGYIEYFADPNPPLREIVRVLKPGGVVVMQSFKPELFGRIDGLLQPLFRNRPKQPGGFVDIKYSGPQLDQLLAGHGLKRTRSLYNNFHVLPRLLRVKLPRLYMSLSERLGHRGQFLGSLLAANYIGRYQLNA